MKLKGQTQAFAIGIGMILLFVVLAMLLTFSANILQSNQASFSNTSIAWEVANNSLSGASNIGDQVPTLGSLVIFVIVLLALISVVGALKFTGRI